MDHGASERGQTAEVRSHKSWGGSQAVQSEHRRESPGIIRRWGRLAQNKNIGVNQRNRRITGRRRLLTPSGVIGNFRRPQFLRRFRPDFVVAIFLFRHDTRFQPHLEGRPRQVTIDLKSASECHERFCRHSSPCRDQ